MASGDDIDAGRTTGASETTFVVGQRDKDGNDFAGDFVLIAGADAHR